MNIETANRLAELRKKSGLSQEELADKLGLSRQAVSKWERAESSPDTDNLILLAKLYNVSLDELLKTDKPVDEIIKDNKDNMNEDATEKEEAKQDQPKKDKVHIGLDGIHVEDADGESVHIGRGGIHVNDKDYKYDWDKNMSKRHKVVALLNGIFFGLAVITYIMLGLFWKAYCPATDAYNTGWSVGWIVFLLAPTVPSIVDAIWAKRVNKVNFFFMGLSAYLYMGMMTASGWHPWWCLILVGIACHIIAGSIEHAIYGDVKINKKEEQNESVKVHLTDENGETVTVDLSNKDKE